ncbi:MAG: PTS transporter subunit EIIA [Gemmatimonadetes bacterium]|nr:PTS transporter subunit EIIA [Gemmatimonadota bacterium]
MKKITIEEYLPIERISLGFAATDAAAVLAELASLLGGQDSSVREAGRDDLVARENGSTTGGGGGIAFPHARVGSLPGLRLAFLRTAAPVDFAALDGRGVDLFVALAAPAQDRVVHLAALSRLSYVFRSASLRDQLRAAPDPEAVRGLVSRVSSEASRSKSAD